MRFVKTVLGLLSDEKVQDMRKDLESPRKLQNSSRQQFSATTT